MRIMIAGLPGSGKTTQAQKLSQDLQVPFISTGNILRKVAQEDSELGRKVKQSVETGELVDNQTTSQIVEQELQKPEYDEGFIIDGYPRDIEQLSFFDPQFTAVFYLKISASEGRRRLIARHRSDDIPEVIDHRFEVQLERLNPLLDHLRGHYEFKELDGEKSIDEIHSTIMDSLKDKKEEE